MILTSALSDRAGVRLARQLRRPRSPRRPATAHAVATRSHPPSHPRKEGRSDLGADRCEPHPNDQGFDEWYGIPDTSDESLWTIKPGFDTTIAPLPHISEGRKGAPSSEVKVYDLANRAEIDIEITDQTIDFMKRHAAAGQPFYAYVPYTLVHYPTVPSAQFQGVTGNGDWADCLAQMDHSVGRLLDAIDELGLRDDTIVVFTSDNGADTSTPPWIDTTGPSRGRDPSFVG